MSLSVSAVVPSSPAHAVDHATNAQPIPTPTLAQHLQQLANSGFSNEQIATAVGITVTQVLTSLEETSTTAPTAPSTGTGLSIKV